MQQALIKTWPLFFGLGMIMIGNGLQGTLLGLRASLENFSVFSTGMIMTAYYIGFFFGTKQVPKFVADVGHIRVFAALASLASTTVLLHVVIVDPWAWGFIRLLTGFSYAGLYIVVESWLNDSATNETRGMMLGIYMLVTYIGMAIGQSLINVADPSTFELFVVTSVLVSLALLPISLSKRPAPDFSASETIWFVTILKRSPLGVVGMAVSGFTAAALFSLGPVFGLKTGMDSASISIFMAAFILGGITLQIPISWLSDRMDRRFVIIALLLGSTLLAGGLYLSLDYGFISMVITIAVLGAVSLPIYGQCISHVNDHLLPRQFVAASATLLLINGAGAMLGPMTVSGAMEIFGPRAFALSLLSAFGFVSVLGIYRSFTSETVPLEDQGDSILMPARGAGIDVQYDEEEQLSQN